MLDYSFLLTYAFVLCRYRSSSYDPFLDLSVPIHKGESEPPKTTLLGSFKISSGSVETNKSTLEKCLGIFTGRATASAPTRSRFTLSPCDAMRCTLMHQPKRSSTETTCTCARSARRSKGASSS